MSWLPESKLTTDPSEDDAWQLVPFFRGILELSPQALVKSWANGPQLTDTRFGEVIDRDGFDTWTDLTRTWLGSTSATVEPVRVVNSPECSVEEMILHLDGDARGHELPVAVVARWDFDHLLTSVHVYHVARARGSISEVGRDDRDPLDLESLAPVIADHVAALQAGDVHRVVAGFHDDATLRGAAVDAPVVAGTAAIGEFYESVLTGPGPALQVKNVVAEASAYALEVADAGAGGGRRGLLVFDCDAPGQIIRHRVYGTVHGDNSWADSSRLRT